MDWEAHQEATMAKVLQATFGLWSALLTVNGLVLTVFTALYVLVPTIPTVLILFLIVACVVSVCLILFSHVAIKSMYYRTGEVMAMADAGHEFSKAEKERDVRDSLRRHKAVRVCETLALLLFVVEVLLVAAIAYSAMLHRAT